MTFSGIPADVRAFVREHIDSLEQLEVLLLVHRSAPRRWSAAAVSRELRIDVASAARRLADLHGRRLLERAGDGDEAEYWHAPDSAHDSVLRDLAATYAERRVTLIEFIFAAPVREVRVFADAFRIRKKED
jgi:hypothetical protein